MICYCAEPEFALYYLPNGSSSSPMETHPTQQPPFSRPRTASNSAPALPKAGKRCFSFPEKHRCSSSAPCQGRFPSFRVSKGLTGGSFRGCFFLFEELTACFQGQRKSHHRRSWNYQALQKARERLGQAFSVMFSPPPACQALVAMTPDPLGTPDRHVPEVTPDFLSG